MATKTSDTQLANLDIWGMLRRLNRMSYELRRCQSADLPNCLLDPDRARLTDYIGDFRKHLVYVGAQPIPDTPESHGQFTLSMPPADDTPEANEIENDDIGSILYQLEVYRIEMMGCQSGRIVQGILTFDFQRMSDGINRLENFVTYITETQPSDRPESTPRNEPVPAGRSGDTK